MVEAVSNTKVFSFPVDELVDEAIDMVGKEFVSGVEASNARRSLNLVIQSLMNKGVPLSTIKEETVSLVQGQETYTLPVGVSDVLGESGYLVRNSKDYPLNRMSYKDYMTIHNKTEEGRPTSFMVDREYDTVKVTVWKSPENSTDSLKLLCSTYVDTVTAAYELIQLPRRFYPALVAGLAYQLSKKRQGIPENYRMRLQMDYQTELDLALFEDGERVDFNVTPGVAAIRRR